MTSQRAEIGETTDKQNSMKLSKTSSPTLFDLPLNIMKKIVKKLHPYDWISVRNSNGNLRSFIDTLKLDLDIDIFIEGHRYTIVLNGKSFRYRYRFVPYDEISNARNEPFHPVVADDERRTIYNKGLQFALRKLFNVMKLPKAQIEKFSLDFDSIGARIFVFFIDFSWNFGAQIAMGADGGTIPKRCELVKERKKKEKLDKHVKNATKWRNCQLTQLPLKRPVIACRFGKLYNKEDVINSILSKTISKSASASHIKGPKDFVELKLTLNKDFKRGDVKGDDYNDVNQTEFICPITNVPMNGIQSFLVNWQCGCVYSEKAQQEVKSSNCHVCGGPYDATKMVILNPEPEQLELYKLKWEAEKAEKAAAKKDKAKKTAEKMEAAASLAAGSGGEASSVAPGPSGSGVGKHVDLKKKLEIAKLTGGSTSEKKAEKRKANTDIQSDPTTSDTYKKLFTTCEAAKNKTEGHWVTYNPLYY